MEEHHRRLPRPALDRSAHRAGRRLGRRSLDLSLALLLVRTGGLERPILVAPALTARGWEDRVLLSKETVPMRAS